MLFKSDRLSVKKSNQSNNYKLKRNFASFKKWLRGKKCIIVIVASLHFRIITIPDIIFLLMVRWQTVKLSSASSSRHS